jgi:hypothetical protein
VLAAGALAVAATGGCGDDAGRTTVQTPRVVSAGDVARYGPGTPQRALLEVVRALEYSDYARVAEFLAPRWHRDGASLARRLSSVSLTFIGVPAIRSKRLPTGTVRLDLSARAGRQKVFMRRIGGHWKVERVAGLRGG